MKNSYLIADFFQLTHSVKIYVPGTIDGDKPTIVLQEEKTNAAIKLFSELFGGATSGDFVGAWKNTAGVIVTEPIKIVYSFCSEDQLAAGLPGVLNFALDLCRDMKQEAISVEIDGVLHFVTL